jgi:putative salt-induced outer membrane protein
LRRGSTRTPCQPGLATSVNSDSESINANFETLCNHAPWSHSLAGTAIKASTSGLTTAEAYSLGWQSKYNLNETDYVFGLISWDKDEFSAYDQQTREAIGYGRHFFDTGVHLLSGEIGVGARQFDLRDGTSDSDTILYLGGKYEWTISETSQFSQLLAIEHGSANTYIEATSALNAKVSADLALVLSFTVKNNSDVLPNTKKTDTFTTISLEYAF